MYMISTHVWGVAQHYLVLDQSELFPKLLTCYEDVKIAVSGDDKMLGKSLRMGGNNIHMPIFDRLAPINCNKNFGVSRPKNHFLPHIELAFWTIWK